MNEEELQERFKASIILYIPRDGSKSYDTPFRCRFGFHKFMGLDHCTLCGFRKANES